MSSAHTQDSLQWRWLKFTALQKTSIVYKVRSPHCRNVSTNMAHFALYVCKLCHVMSHQNFIFSCISSLSAAAAATTASKPFQSSYICMALLPLFVTISYCSTGYPYSRHTGYSFQDQIYCHPRCQVVHCTFNPLKTKRRLLYLKTQFVPRSKHFSSRL